MKLVVKKSEAKILDEHGVSKFAEYDLPFNRFSTGISQINGKYPQSGFDVDTKVEASWYVLSGSGEIYLAGEVYKVEEGDMIFVPKGEKFWIKGNNLKLVVTSSPPWEPSQHKHLE